MVEMGPQRLLWGSDWPCTNHEALADYAALRQALDVWLGDAAAARAALVINPQRLYWLQGSPE
jgi:predicted TIM-barrel fold metal-dependent hydrolase